MEKKSTRLYFIAESAVCVSHKCLTSSEKEKAMEESEQKKAAERNGKQEMFEGKDAYIRTMLVFLDIDITITPYLCAFSGHLTRQRTENKEFRCIIRTDSMVRRNVSHLLDVSDRAVFFAIRKLTDTGIFIPVEENGKKKRGIYYVQPWVLSREEWIEFGSVQVEFRFSEPASAAVYAVRNNKKGFQICTCSR